MQKIITLDSQILNTISLCERRAKYAFIDSIEPRERGESLERGLLLHHMLEINEGLRCDLVDLKSETWQKLQEIGILLGAEPFEEFAIRAARLLATKMDISTTEIEEVIFQFEEYIKYYKDDPWETLAIESVGSKLLYEDMEYKILYTFKIDRLAKKDNLIVPWDYKTSKRRQITSSLSNQFIGYAWATGSNYVIVDKIGFQKTLAPNERFQRIFLSYDNERIEEWIKNSIFWALQYARLLKEPQTSTMNLTSCDKYGGCIFRPVCEKGASARSWIIERDYKVKEIWDPAKVLEEQEN